MRVSTWLAAALILVAGLAPPLGAETVTETYSYDAAGRLRGVAFGATGQSYEYDDAGNLLARTVPEPGAAAALAAGAALAFLARRRRRAAIALVAIGAFAGVEPAAAHDCKNNNIRMVQGQVIDDLFAIDADLVEDFSLYTLTAVNPPGFVTVAPAGPNYQTHDLYVNVRANTVGSGIFSIFWDYPPNFASASCIYNVEVVAQGQTTSNADHRQSALSGDPVNALTGEFVMNEAPDLLIPGPMPIVFQRYYGSALERLFVQSPMGANWRHNYDWTIHQNGNALTIKDSRGRVTRFLETDTINHVFQQQNNLDLPLTVKHEILPTENHYHVLDPRTNLIYKFSVPEDADRFYLVEIRDGRGNALALTYNLDGQLLTVSDGLGRTLSLTYRPHFAIAGGTIASISDGTRTVTFTHNSDRSLTAVQDATGETSGYAYTTVNFAKSLLTGKTWPEGNTPWTQTWDSQARVATQTTAAGDLTTFTYGPTTTISDPRSNETALTHDASGRLTQEVNATNRTRAAAYDATGNRSAVDQPLGGRHLRTHDLASANVSSVTNAAGNTITYQYSNRAVAPGFQFRELTGMLFPDGRSNAYVYDANGNQTSFTDRGNDTWTRTFNARSQVLTETTPLGGMHTYAYNADGTLASITDPGGRQILFQYDALKRTTRVTQPGGAYRQLGWDGKNRLTSFRNEAGGTTTWVYDGNGRLISKTDPAGAIETRGYDAMNRLTSITDRTGAVQNFTYDELGGPATAELVGIGTYEYTYDDDGRLASLLLPDGSNFDSSFDANGRLTGTTNPGGQQESTVLDDDDLVVERIDHAGQSTSFEYDVLGRVVASTDPTGRTESIEYDAEDQASRVELGGLAIDVFHNAVGNVTQMLDPNGGAWGWVYNGRGIAVSSSDPLGRTTTYAYDGRDRVSTATFPSGLGTEQMSYDGTGNATRRLFSDGVDLVYTLDAQGRVTAAPGVTLGYDARSRITSSNGVTATRRPHQGQVASLVLAPGKTVTYQYDEAGRPLSVTDWLGGTTTFLYDAAGQRTGIQRPNGVTTTTVYDAAGRATSIAHGALGTITLVRDEAGRPTSATRNLPTATPPATNGTFSYDQASQVASYTYDALGRRTSGAGRTFAWDLASRLTSLVEAAVTTTLGWDAFGRLVSLDRGTTNRDFVWSYALPFPAISIELEDGAALRHYVHDPAGRLLYAVDAGTNARHFFHFDERGNTVFVTNGAGAVEASWAYGPYGEVTASTPGFDNPFTFAGEWGGQQIAPGLFQMGRRSYDVTTAAFLSRDAVHPHLHPLTANPYQYAGRDPISRIDPMGGDVVDAAAANQNATDQGVLKTATDTINTVTGVADIAGSELGAVADDTARAANRALGASTTLAHEAQDFIANNLGGNSTSQKVLRAAEGYMEESLKLDARAEKLAGQSRTLKAVGAAGQALTALEIGTELYKLYDKIFEAHAFNDEIERGIYQTFVNQSKAAMDVYKRGLQNEYWLRKHLIDIKYNMDIALLWQGYLYSVENHLNFWTAVGNIYGAFVPGFSFVGTEGVANAAHKHVWTKVYATVGNPWD